MININELILKAKDNEPKVIYDSYKVLGTAEQEWDTSTLNGGGSAHVVILNKTITLTYVDGTVATYTEE